VHVHVGIGWNVRNSVSRALDRVGGPPRQRTVAMNGYGTCSHRADPERTVLEIKRHVRRCERPFDGARQD
jgi:hypothetical protein